MTTPPAPRPPQGQPRAAAPPSPPPAVAIDPIKLARKYVWLIGAAGVLGVMLGVVMYYVLLTLAPKFTSEVIFECFPPENNVAEIQGTGDEKEMERFMLTQVARMKSDGVLERVARDGRLASQAGDWARSVTVRGQIDEKEAIEELEDNSGAGIIPGTNWIRLSFQDPNKADATTIVKLLKEAYLRELNYIHTAEFAERRDALQEQIDEIEEEIQDLSSQRARIVADNNIDALNQQGSESSTSLDLVVGRLSVVQDEMQGLNVQIAQLEEMQRSEAGITYTDTQRALVEGNPHVANLLSQRRTLETQIDALRQGGILPGHRSYQSVEQQLDAVMQNLNKSREEELLKLFNAELSTARDQVAQLRAQELDLLRKREELVLRTTELTRILSDIEDIDNRLGGLERSRATLGEDLRQVTAAGTLTNAQRVKVSQSERIPKEVSFPKVIVMLPAGLFITGSLVGLFIVVREILDQRIKSPSDIAMIPRARVLGMIPDTEEDPTTPERAETAFVDNPGSTSAESFRQLRTSIIEKLKQTGGKSVMVVAGMPGSGSTTTVMNLAHACAASDMKVLVIDANLRRPKIHELAGLDESPGLAGVLAGEVSLEQAARATGDDHLRIITAGDADKRVYERLGSDRMSALLEQAKSQYDLILLDTAPAIVAGDASTLATRVDASVFVVRAFREKRGMAARILNDLRNSKAVLLGTVVNGVRASAGGYMKKNIRVSHEYVWADRSASDPKGEPKPA